MSDKAIPPLSFANWPYHPRNIFRDRNSGHPTPSKKPPKFERRVPDPITGEPKEVFVGMPKGKKQRRGGFTNA